MRIALRSRLNPTTSALTSRLRRGARANPKRVIFAEAEEEVVLRAAIAFKEGGYGTPVLVGREDVPDRLAALGVRHPEEYEVHNSFRSPLVPAMVDRLYERLQRRGYLRRDCERLVNRDRNIFGALLLKMGEADAMITGVTRTYAQTLRELRRVLDPAGGPRAVRGARAGRALAHDLPGGHDGERAADARHAGRHRGGHGGGRAPHGAGAARRLPVLLHLRQPAGHLARQHPRRGGRAGAARAAVRVRGRNGAGRGAKPGPSPPPTPSAA